MTSRRVAVLLVLVGSGLALVAQGRPWASGQVGNGLSAASQVSVSGAVAAPGLTALALVAAAGAVVLATAGRRVRRVAAAMIAAAGGGITALAARVISDPGQALRGPAVEESGITTITPVLADATGWITMGLVGGLLVLAGAGLALLRAGTWSSPPARYERAGRSAADDEPLWDAISRGEDPTG